jgi:hypothetical protein
MEVQAWRVKVMKVMMAHGIPLERLDGSLRELLEDGPPVPSAKLTSSGFTLNVGKFFLEASASKDLTNRG